MNSITFSPAFSLHKSALQHKSSPNNLYFGHKTATPKDTVEITGTKNKNKVYPFGTSGFREIGTKFTDALPIILNSMSDHLIDEFEKSGSKKPKPIIIGLDTRELSKTGQWIAASHFFSKGFDVYLDTSVMATPALAYYAKNWHELGGKDKDVAGAILFTASHNPWNYGGINFLTPDGEVAPTSLTKKFEALQAQPTNKMIDRNKLGLPQAQIFKIPSQPIYSNHLEKLIDFEKIKKSKIEIAYDSMYGAAVTEFANILTHQGIRRVTSIRQNWQEPWKSFHEIPGGPDPTDKNLGELKTALSNIKQPNNLKVGLANDGDADRFGVIDEKGNFIQPNDVIALVLYHLIKNKNREGVVVRSQATSHMLDELAQKYRFPVEQTPVGYKYIAEVFKESEKTPHKVIIGGESSGGLSIYGHIPEKDGIIANLSILELMAYENKPIGEILKDLRKGLKNQYLFTEFEITTTKQNEVADHFVDLFNKGGQFGGLEIDLQKSQDEAKKLKEKFHTQDGTKLYFKDGSWLLVRKSGTEPKARIYFEAIDANAKAAEDKSSRLDAEVKKLLADKFQVAEKNIKTKISGTSSTQEG